VTIEKRRHRIWFSILVEKIFRPGNFRSAPHPRPRIDGLPVYFDATFKVFVTARADGLDCNG
jgi:hypothetical protein